MTTTSSPLRSLFMSQHFRCERDDLHELRSAQLTRHGSEDAGADRLELAREQHGRVAVEADQGAVRAPYAVRRAHDDRVVDLALLDLAARNRVLDADLDDVADARVATLRAAEHLDAHEAASAAVVSGLEH